MTMHDLRVLPLVDPRHVAQTVYLCELQPLLRHAESLGDDVAAGPDYLEAERDAQWAHVVAQPWWTVETGGTDEEKVARLSQVGEALLTTDLDAFGAVSRAAALLLLADVARTPDDDGSPIQPAQFIRAMLECYPVGDRSGLALVWPEGQSREARWDARVVRSAALDPHLASQVELGDAPFALIGLIDGHQDDQVNGPMMDEPDAEVVVVVGDDLQACMRLGRVSAMRDLMHLFGYNLACSEERMAVAVSFAQIVQQQQKLYASLDANGIRVDMSEPVDARVPPPAATPNSAFYLGVHDTMLVYMREIQQAKEQDRLVTFGLGVLQGLRDRIAAMTPSVPGLPMQWWPDARATRQPLNEVDTHMLGYVTNGDVRVPALVRMPPASVRRLRDRGHAQEHQATVH